MHFIHSVGSEAKGGNVRYAEIMHQTMLDLGFNSNLLPVGKIPCSEVICNSNNNKTTIIFHAPNQLDRKQLIYLRCNLGCSLIMIAHNPQTPKNYDLYNLIVPVSEYVYRKLFSGIPLNVAVYQRPAYLPACRLKKYIDTEGAALPPRRQNSEYEWNKKKLRDNVLSVADLFKFRLRLLAGWGNISSQKFKNNDRIKIAVISRIARLKNFPELFGLLSESFAMLADRLEIHIVGSGPWRQVNDLKAAIPISLRPHVYFWGWQSVPWSCLPKIDALILGMPDKEALGLNILEATIRRVPVIGIDGGPFPEVVETGNNGWLLSKGAISSDFLKIIGAIQNKSSTCSFEMSSTYINNFSEERFRGVLTEIFSDKNINS